MRVALAKGCVGLAKGYRRLVLVAVVAASAVLSAAAVSSVSARAIGVDQQEKADQIPTATPIKHLVVLFQENVPFDHYFGTYPNALNPAGEPAFVAAAGTPTVNGYTDALLNHNPNLANPKRLDRTDGNICGSNHSYGPEQQAFDNGLMDMFVQDTGSHAAGCDGTHGMDYYDGNTVTALWNYAQHFAMSDNSFGTTFGPSHIGAINLVSGNNHGAVTSQPTSNVIDGTQIGNVEPTFDDCPVSALNIHFTGRNIGDLLNQQGISWGFFSGGFRPTARLLDGSPICGQQHVNADGQLETDYDSGNDPFQYYQSTANQLHLAPSSVAAIGHDDQANHQYDLTDFWAAAEAGNLPAVSFLKAPGEEQGGLGGSSPLLEQQYIVDVVNNLEQLPTWRSTAVIIMYDDSDGGYDHVMPPIVNDSQTSADALTGPGQCGTQAPILAGYQGRCGYGPRLPFLVISPWARTNFVDHTLTDQTSVIHFIEDNWLGGARIGDGSYDALSGPITGMFNFSAKTEAPKLFLAPDTGEPAGASVVVPPAPPVQASVAPDLLAKAGEPTPVTVTFASGLPHPITVNYQVAEPSSGAVTVSPEQGSITVPPGGTSVTLTATAGGVGSQHVLVNLSTVVSGKTVELSPAVLNIVVPDDSLAAAFSNVGITDDSDHTPGNFDGSGNSYSAEALAGVGITPGTILTARNVDLTWPDVPAGTADNVVTQGQAIALSGTGSTLAFLGAGVSGTQTGTGTILYADGTIASFSLRFADFISTSPADGDDLVATMPYFNRTRPGPARTPSIFAAYVPLAGSKQVAAIILPNNTRMHIFAAAIGG
ncbi:MAG: alkaline phosphatase family protein [Actinobacteria bacterium]|nr:alkaline phosphatase family protein [Actinomycetota bacterium]